MIDAEKLVCAEVVDDSEPVLCSQCKVRITNVEGKVEAAQSAVRARRSKRSDIDAPKS